jgi:hypothetical protein
VLLAARLNALVDVWIDRLGSLGSVCLHARSRGENGGRRWLVLEAERPNLCACGDGERRADQRPDQNKGQGKLKSDHESYQVQRATNVSVSPGYGHLPVDIRAS